MTIRSAVPLPGLPEVEQAVAADVELRWHPTEHVPPDLPRGEPLLRLELDGATRYAAAFDGHLYRLRFPGCCEFEIDAALHTVDCHAVDRGLASVLAAGALTSFLLTVGGATVLHASAVEVGGVAVGIVGASGFGKSTVAALLCAGGCDLVTDDVLRVDLAQEGVLVHAGADEVRLRPTVRAIAECFAHDVPSRDTPDGRLAIRPPRTTRARLPLAALVLPRAGQGADDVSVRRLPRMHALINLLAFPRLLGWTSSDVLSRQFDALADLVQCVPFLEARVPVGPPFAAETGRRLRRALLAGVRPDHTPVELRL
jgi:hypothetical protein